jgi:transcriptional regulator with XRE-family HTH domain
VAAVEDVAEDRFAPMRLALARRRKALGMSMSALAREVGISPSMVSQIERGQTLPSVATLFALATALGADVDIFFGDREDGERLRRAPALAEARPEAVARQTREQLYVVRRGERASVDIRGGVRWERLTPQPLEIVEFLELVYSPGAESSPELYRHPGTEMVLVLEGTFRIHIGFEQYVLEHGDSIQFPSSLPHRYVNPTDRVARAVTVILADAADMRGDEPTPP